MVPVADYADIVVQAGVVVSSRAMTPIPSRRDQDPLVVVRRVEVGGVMSMVVVLAGALPLMSN